MECNLIACENNCKGECTVLGVRDGWIECNKVVNIDNKRAKFTYKYGCNQMCADWGTRVCVKCSSSNY